MKSARLLSLICVLLACGGASITAAPVEYVKVCSSYGSGFMYIPGTDTCHNPLTGDTRQATENGAWRSRLPYPNGSWVKSPRLACLEGKVVRVGTFESTDFTLNAWGRKGSSPIPLPVEESEYISKVMMSGGFYDPRLRGHRSGTQGSAVFCLRTLDPSISELVPEPNPEDPPAKPRFGNGMLPIGCIPNNRILNVPATYSIDADAMHPAADLGFADAEQTEIYGPFVYDTHVAVTSDFGTTGEKLFTYHDAADGLDKPLAGTVTISVCIAPRFPRVPRP